MKKLDRFILTSFVGPFFAILLIVVFILVLQFLWLYIDELVGKGLEFKVIMEFLMWGSCQTLPLALPLATLLSSMMTLGQMGENYELTAMKAAGISLSRILLPMTIAAAVISVATFFVCDRLVPHAMNQLYTMRDDFRHTKSEIKIPVGTFYDGIEGYILRVGDRDRESGMMYDVIVYDHSKNRGNTAITVADSGIIKMSKAKDYLTFSLYSGTNYQETNTKKYRDTTLALQRIRFARQDMIISLENYAFQHSDSARYGEQVKSMSIKQLSKGHDSLTNLVMTNLERHLQELDKSTVLTYRKQLDTSWKSKSVMAQPEISWPSLEKEKRAYENASSRASQFESTLRSQAMEAYDYTRLLRRTDVEMWKKYAQALACFLLFFIGAPIGALIKKGGLGTPAVISILFFVLYWVVDISGTKLANDGATPAAVGDFISAMVLAPIGAFLTWKAIEDSALFNMDGFKTGWRRLISKIWSFFRKTRIVFMGTPEFAVASLDALLGKGYKVVGVVTAVDKPSGRGMKLNESAVKQYAVARGIPLLQPEKLKDPEFLKALAAWRADMFVVVGFRMLPKEVWAMPRLGTFNLHAALLPQYRGAAPINWAVINGENITGVTTFMIDKNIDTGGILLRQELRIKPEDTAGTVHDALMEIGASLVVDTVEGLIQHNLETRTQRSFVQGSELLYPAPKLTPELRSIDWNDSVRNIVNLIRGLSPYPAAFTTLEGLDGAQLQLKIFFAGEHSLPVPEGTAPGTVLTDGKTYFAIAAEDGAVALKDIQLQGKKRMDTGSFLKGFRNPESYRALSGTSRAELDKARPVED